MRISIFIFAIFFIAGCEPKKPLKEAEKPPVVAEPEIRNERPVMTFTLSDGEQVDVRDLDQQMVLVLFQPDCSHCKDEAKQIKNRLEAFTNYNLYFISSQPMEEVNNFAKEYGLDGLANVHFGWTSVESVLNNFGAISAPSIYIYTKEGRLVESFEGQVDVETVIRYL